MDLKIELSAYPSFRRKHVSTSRETFQPYFSDEVQDWLKTNDIAYLLIGGSFRDETYTTLFFENPDDMMRFKLTWL
jgi:hypothetical protein